MSLKIEQNWKWSNKTFPHTLCVVSTSYETTHCGIYLTSDKNLHWASGGGMFGPKITFFGTISSLKIGVLLGKCFRKQTNSQKSVYMIAKYHLSSQQKCYQFFSRPPLTVPVHCHLQRGGRFLTRLKNRHF